MEFTNSTLNNIIVSKSSTTTSGVSCEVCNQDGADYITRDRIHWFQTSPPLSEDDQRLFNWQHFHYNRIYHYIFNQIKSNNSKIREKRSNNNDDTRSWFHKKIIDIFVGDRHILDIKQTCARYAIYAILIFAVMSTIFPLWIYVHFENDHDEYELDLSENNLTVKNSQLDILNISQLPYKWINSINNLQTQYENIYLSNFSRHYKHCLSDILHDGLYPSYRKEPFAMLNDNELNVTGLKNNSIYQTRFNICNLNSTIKISEIDNINFHYFLDIRQFVLKVNDNNEESHKLLPTLNGISLNYHQFKSLCKKTSFIDSFVINELLKQTRIKK